MVIYCSHNWLLSSNQIYWWLLFLIAVVPNMVLELQFDMILDGSHHGYLQLVNLIRGMWITVTLGLQIKLSIGLIGHGMLIILN